MATDYAFRGARLAGAVIDTPANFTIIPVTVNAAALTGTATVAAGSVIIGCVSAGNQDQFISNVAISGTTLTVTLKAAATATNNFKVTVVGA